MSALTLLQRVSITGKHRQDWYRAMAKTAGDGLPYFEVLDKMSQEFVKTKHPLTPLIKVLLFRLRGGGPANKRSPDGHRTIGTELQGLVPADEAMLIQAGVLAARMGEGLTNAADLLATKAKMKGTIFSALAKPVGYLAALLGLLIFFSIKLLPKFEESRPRAGWSTEAQLLGTVADNIGWITAGVVGSLIGVVVFVVFIGPKWTGARREWVDSHIWPFTMLAALDGANFLVSLAGYMSAGTSFHEAVSNIKLAATPYMKWQCEKLIRQLRNGIRPEHALPQLSIIQPRYHWIIAVYGLSGDSVLAYKTIAKEMVESTQEFIVNLFERVIANILLAFIGAVLLWIYGSIFGITVPRTMPLGVSTLPVIYASGRCVDDCATFEVIGTADDRARLVALALPSRVNATTPL